MQNIIPNGYWKSALWIFQFPNFDSKMKTSKLNKHVQVRSSKIKNKVKEVLNELQQLYDPAVPIHVQAFNEFQKLLDDQSFHSRTMQVRMSGACMINQNY